MSSLFFELIYDDNSPGGNAEVPEEIYYEKYYKIEEMDTLPFSFVLDNNLFEDFILNNLDRPLVSPRLKAIFDRYQKTAPQYKSLPVRVVSNNQRVSFPYFLMVFMEKPDVLDHERTRIIQHDYIYGYFDFKKIKNYDFFPQPRDHDGSLVVSDTVRRDLELNGITGIAFRRAEVSNCA